MPRLLRENENLLIGGVRCFGSAIVFVKLLTYRQYNDDTIN